MELLFQLVIDIAVRVKASGGDREMLPQFLKAVDGLLLQAEGHQHLLAVSKEFSQKLKVFDKDFPATGDAAKIRVDIFKRVYTLLSKK